MSKKKKGKKNVIGQLGTIGLHKLAQLVVLNHQVKGIEISQAKLQKILYFIQGGHLAKFGKPLFKEDAQAWANGAGYEEIIDFSTTTPIETGLVFPSDLSIDQIAFLEYALDFFREKSESALIIFGYKEQAWNEARRDVPIFQTSNKIINKEMILNSFSKR